MPISYDELRALFENFQWIDDIPEDQAKRDEICLEAKAALLIEANCTSERFPAFIRLAEKVGDKYKLPESVSIHYQENDFNYNPFDIDIFCDCFAIERGKENNKNWDMATAIYSNKEYSQEYYDCSVNINGTLLFDEKERKNYVCRYNSELQNVFYTKYPSLFSICKELTPYKSVAQMCRFWGGTSEAFGKIKPRNMYPDYIWGDKSLRKRDDQEHWTDARLEQYAFQFLIPCQSPLMDDFALPNRYYDNWYCHIFPFRNQYGETIMNVVKVYDQETQCKILLPMTTWIRNNSRQSQIFCVPYPADKMPLYNLDKLLAPECETVILCDSVELADANQKKNGSEKLVFTSFICSPGRYAQVDWSPLQDKELFLLVSNHSGISFEAAALKTQELTEYLSENTDLEYKLLVLEVAYGKYRMRGFDNVDDILKMYQENPPQMNPSELLILEYEDEIDEFFQAAEKELNRLPDKWWLKTDVPQEEKRIAEGKNSKLAPIDYIMHPLLVRGEATLLYAKKSIGKSSLAYSIAARVAAAGFSDNPVPLLKGKWWNVPKQVHKVLYLDFENMGAMESKKQTFQSGYIPEARADECRANLIMKDVADCAIDFSLPENHQKILDMIEDAKKNEGIPGKAVDLLVIDTYTGLVRTETPATPANFKDLIDKIRRMGIAVLITHHANSDNEIRGLQSKLDKIALTINISRNEAKDDGNLDEQPCFVKYELPRYPMRSELKKPFEIIFDSEHKQWKLTDKDHNEDSDFYLIVEGYKKLEFDRSAICQMLGLKKTSYHEHLKKAPQKK